ncbi:alpha/beta fold hydrolase [Myxococcus landrumensis]|uniref:Alpha/beta hydrolase n=1 Tax=Myxococcus landrumensis TaxID=2813577 RepID=A0ABX7N5G3_9BACT|nr:alpha/beta hydrolase [Myxococcus landrumus]QSQ13629.1 alpha/beta hydrolase [Myxococcus landrumus]
MKGFPQAGAPSAGPEESSLLAQLSPAVKAAVHWIPDGGALRVLEGGHGPTVLLLHGRGGAASTWFAYLTALARTHRVLAVDLPGFGMSSSGGGTVHSAEEGVRFFTDPVEALLEQLAPGPVSVVGHSLGGLVGLELALRTRVPVERLVLLDAMGLGPDMTRKARAFFRAGPERLARSLGPWAWARMMPPAPTPLGQRLGALEYELMSIPGGRDEAAHAFDKLVPLTGPVFHRQEKLTQVTAPVLLIWGEREEVLPVSLAEEALRRFPNARLVRMDAAHSPHHERPERVLPELKSFLETPRDAEKP